MAYFERKGVLLSTTQLLAQVQSHFTHQALQQAYVLILGLDVLGNPYGLIKDFTQGLGDFFYEPFLVRFSYSWYYTLFLSDKKKKKSKTTKIIL